MLAARRRAGRFDSFSEHLGALDLFPGGAPEPPASATTAAGRSSPPRSTSRCARRARSLPSALGREPRPLRFGVSSRLGDPPTLAPVTRRLAAYPDLRFKLDARPTGTTS